MLATVPSLHDSLRGSRGLLKALHACCDDKPPGRPFGAFPFQTPWNDTVGRTLGQSKTRFSRFNRAAREEGPGAAEPSMQGVM